MHVVPFLTLDLGVVTDRNHKQRIVVTNTSFSSTPHANKYYTQLTNTLILTLSHTRALSSLSSCIAFLRSSTLAFIPLVW